MAAVGWQNGTSGNWTDPTGWTSQVVPGPVDDVTIGAAGSYTVTLNTAVAVDSLTLGAIAPGSGNATLALTGTAAALGVTFDLANTGTLSVDTGTGDGGGTIAVGGTFDNSGMLLLGPSDNSLGAGATIDAGALINTGGILLDGGAGAASSNQAALVVLSIAPAVLAGSYDLAGNAMLAFITGGVTAIAPGALVVEHGGGAYVADINATTSNSALTTLASIGGELDLDGGASVATGGDFALSGTLRIDDQGGSGGSGLSVTGTLDNSGVLLLGPSDFSLSGNGDTVSAAGLLNTGSIVLTGGRGANPAAAMLFVNAVAPSLLTGNYVLDGNAAVQFGAGQITGIASGASLREGGAAAVMALLTVPASNAALTALAAIAGTLDLEAGASVTLAGDLAITGTVALDTASGAYGSALRLAGTLTNAGVMSVGPSDLRLGGSDTIAAAGLVNTGRIALSGGTGANASRALLNVAGPAPGALTGSYDLEGAALLRFAGGAITSIASGATLREADAAALVAVGGDLASNSALAALATIAGELDLDNGASVTIRGDLSVTGTMRLDDRGGAGGSAAGVGGTLSNSGGIFVGPSDLTLAASAAITTGHLVNTGTITLDGSGGTGLPRASLLVGDAAPASWAGGASLSGNALLEFSSGAITGIAGSGSLAENGAASRITSGGDTGTNGALTGLSMIAGELDLDNGASLATQGDLAVTGRLSLDSLDGAGFSNLGIGGTLVNSGAVFVGQNDATMGGNASAAALVNTGQLILRGGTTSRATLTILGAAPASLTGDVVLFANSAVQFASGGVTGIAAGTFLGEAGGAAVLALASAPTANSALAGLANVAGELDLVGGASITTTADLAVSGAVAMDVARATGGSGLTIGGTLSNAGLVMLGAGDGSLAASDTLAASSLNNTGTIALTGGGTTAALLLLSGTAANAGMVVIGTGATLAASGAGGFTQSAGLTTLAGTLAGALTLGGGVVEGTGTVAGAVTNAGGTLIAGLGPTQPGRIGIAGGYTQGGGGALEIALGGTAAGTYGVVGIGGGAVSLHGGTLEIQTVNGFTLAAGEVFPVLTFTPGQLTGAFAALAFNGVLVPSGTAIGVGGDLNIDVVQDNADGVINLAVDSTAAPAQALVSPATINVGALHVGASATARLTVANTAPAPAAGLDASVATVGGAGFAGGQASLIGAGASDTTSISVGVTATTDGALAGTVTLALASDPGDGAAPTVLPSQTVSVTGVAYNTAVASLATPAPVIAHVGDHGTITLNLINTAPADGFSENLVASVSGAAGGFTASGGPTGEIAAGGGMVGALTVSYTASRAGVISGGATIAVTSDGGTGANSIDGLGTTTLAPIAVPLAITVDNTAQPSFEVMSGPGTITGGGGAFTLDLGTITQGTGLVAVGLGVVNAANGPADLLSGSLAATGAFATGGLAAFSGLAAGQADAAPMLTLDTGQAGAFAETITLSTFGSNASGYKGNLPTKTLTVMADVAASGSVSGSAGGPITIGSPGPGAVSIMGPNGTVEWVSFGSAAAAALAAPLLAALDLTRTSFFNAAGAATLAAGQVAAIIAATGAVSLSGNGAANQLIAAGSGAFNFIAGAGSSGTVVAGAGNDLIYDPAAGGNWLMTLGGGSDTVVASGGNDSIATGAGGSLVFLGAGASSVGSGGADTMIGGTGSATIAPAANNALVFALGGPLVFIGGAGASTVVAGAVPATLFGGASGGSLVFGDGSTQFTGGGATDTVVGLAGSMTVQGGAGGGLFFGGTAGNNIITAGSGNVTAFGGGAGDVLTATATASDLFAGGVGAETLSGAGSSGTNTFFAGFGPETLLGGAGLTALVAGAGADLLTGGSGVTLFLFVNGRTAGFADTISGFDATHDFVKLAGYASGNAAVVGAAKVANGSATIALSDGTHVTFAGVTTLNPASFT